MTTNNTLATKQARVALEALIAACQKEAQSLEAQADGMLKKAATLRSRQEGLKEAVALLTPVAPTTRPPKVRVHIPVDIPCDTAPVKAKPTGKTEAQKVLDDPETSLIARVWLHCRGREVRTLDLAAEMEMPYGNVASAIQGLCRNGYASRVRRGTYKFKRYRRGMALR